MFSWFEVTSGFIEIKLCSFWFLFWNIAGWTQNQIFLQDGVFHFFITHLEYSVRGGTSLCDTLYFTRKFFPGNCLPGAAAVDGPADPLLSVLLRNFQQYGPRIRAGFLLSLFCGGPPSPPPLPQHPASGNEGASGLQRPHLQKGEAFLKYSFSSSSSTETLNSVFFLFKILTFQSLRLRSKDIDIGKITNLLSNDVGRFEQV